MASILPELTRFTPTYVHLITAALFPIYTASHSSLRRPANTLTPSQARALLATGSTSDDDEDEDESTTPTKAETLTAQDAMMFPVTAGVLLATLYLIIKYLDDPTLLSRILTWYFCFMGIFAVGKASADIMGLFVAGLFPDSWTDNEGKKWVAGYNGWKLAEGNGEARSGVQSPVPVMRNGGKWLWKVRRTVKATWQVKVTAGEEKVVKNLWIGDVIGPVIGALVVAVYALGDKHWLLTNIMGISFSYGALQLLSPTTFPIATLLLGLLFFYDIFFVFYTPLMVTVATNLDVPIKLLFPRPGTTPAGKPALAMLGLGDVVIPGLVVAMALRFDLWRHYELRRQALLTAAQTGKSEKLTPEEEAKYKPAFFNPKHLWATKWWNPAQQVAGEFNKPYFTAAMGGYVAGMIATLVVMHVFKHAQPALLYLVPGVLGALWGTAAVKGEVKAVWAYSEEAEEEKVDEETAKKREEEEKKKKEEKEKREKEEEERYGEEAKVWLDLSIVRKPAAGAGRVKKTVEKQGGEARKVQSRESTGVKVEENDDGDEVEEISGSSSDDSSEVVDVGKDGEMWGTTVIGSDG